MRSKLFGVLVCVVAVSAYSATPSDISLKVVTHYKVAGSGNVQGLAVDPEARKIYLARGSMVDILNADTGALTGQVSVGDGASGVTIIADMKRGIATSSGSSTISLFDTESGKVLKRIQSNGKGTSSVTYDGESKRLFVANRDSGSVTAIDSESAQLIGTVELGGKVGYLAVNGYGRLFVGAPDTNKIHVVDTHTLKALGDIPAGTGEDCTGLALDPVGRRLFVPCANGRIAVVDADNGATFEDLPGGTGAAAAVFTPLPTGKGGWKGAAFIASADGTLTAVKMNAFISYTVGATAKLSPGIQAVAFDSKTHHILIPAPATDRTGWELLVVSQ